MISIIVPVYKVEQYLAVCVDSILAQTYKDIEVLLIDDGSPDRCGEMCDIYSKRDSRVKVFHTENGGLSAARNVGLKHASGDYIGFVDSDDWIDPDMYEVLLNSIQQNGADMSYCGFCNVFPDDSREIYCPKALDQNENLLEAMLNDKIYSHVWNKLYRRYIFDQLEFPVGLQYEDIQVFPQILFQCNTVSSVTESKYYYRHRADSITMTYSSRQLIDYADAYFQRNEFVKNIYPEHLDSIDAGILQSNAHGIARVWRWWHGCTKDEKLQNADRIKIMKKYICDNVPLFGVQSWPIYLRIAAFFMHSDSKVSFAMIYWLNQAYRKIKGTKAVI